MAHRIIATVIVLFMNLWHTHIVSPVFSDGYISRCAMLESWNVTSAAGTPLALRIVSRLGNDRFKVEISSSGHLGAGVHEE